MKMKLVSFPLGALTMCPSERGLMSRKAKVKLFSYTLKDGMVPRIILQKRQESVRAMIMTSNNFTIPGFSRLNINKKKDNYS